MGGGGIREAPQQHFGAELTHLPPFFLRDSIYTFNMVYVMSQQNIHRAFCENVKSRRTSLGLTQTDLANRLGVTQPVVAAIEAGRRVPTLTTVQQVADALDSSPLELLSEAEKISI